MPSFQSRSHPKILLTRRILQLLGRRRRSRSEELSQVVGPGVVRVVDLLVEGRTASVDARVRLAAGLMIVIEAAEPLDEVVHEAKRYNVVIAGISDGAGLALFGRRHERLAL